MIGEPLARDSRTYYLTGDKIVAVYDKATQISDDVEFLAQHPDNNVSGQHYNCTRWIIDKHNMPADLSDPSHMDCYLIIEADHPISKTIEMYKLIGALPDVAEDWSNDGPI